MRFAQKFNQVSNCAAQTSKSNGALLNCVNNALFERLLHQSADIESRQLPLNWQSVRYLSPAKHPLAAFERLDHEDSEGDQQHRLYCGKREAKELGEGGEGEQEEGQLLQGERQPQRELCEERKPTREFDLGLRV